MKSTNHFKNTIQAYLEQRAASDPQFEWAYTQVDKDIDQCICYILNTVQQSGCNGFHDDEIFGMAEHFYLTDNIEVGKTINAQITVNHVVVLSAEEIEQARKEAIQKAQDEAYNRMKQPKAKKVNLKQTANTNQLTLF